MGQPLQKGLQEVLLKLKLELVVGTIQASLIHSSAKSTPGWDEDIPRGHSSS